MRYLKKLPFLSLILIGLFLNGCNDSGKQANANTPQVIAQEVQLANDMLQQGQAKEGLQILETLDTKYPDNALIIEALAYAYAQTSDHALAAFYFEQLYQINPAKVEATLSAAQNYVEVNEWEAAARNYENYLQRYPNNAMTWRNLGLAKNQLNETKAALKAYLTAIQLNDNKPLSGIEALQVAQLFINFGNAARAQEFYKQALQDPTTKEKALLGLIAVELQSKNTYATAQYLHQLDALNPEAFDSSPLADARTIIALEQSESNALESTQAPLPTLLLGFNADEITQFSKTPLIESMEAITPQELPQKSQAHATAATTSTSDGTTPTHTNKVTSVSLGTPKVATTTKKQAAKESTPTPKVLSSDTTPIHTPRINFDANLEQLKHSKEETPNKPKVLTSSNIAKNTKAKSIGFTEQKPNTQPAPLAGGQTQQQVKTSTQLSTQRQDTFASSTTPTPTTETTPTPSLMVEFTRTHKDETNYFAFKKASAPSTITAQEPKASSSPLDMALRSGIELQSEGKWQEALQQFWNAIELNDSLPEPWSRLSQTYFEAGLTKEAQKAAREALQRNPNSLKYTLNFLRTSQKAMPPEVFLQELLKAKSQFPDAPEITLGLARTYEKVLNQPETAVQYYYEFIHQSPEHPNKTEAKQALQRLL